VFVNLSNVWNKNLYGFNSFKQAVRKKFSQRISHQWHRKTFFKKSHPTDGQDDVATMLFNCFYVLMTSENNVILTACVGRVTFVESLGIYTG